MIYSGGAFGAVQKFYKNGIKPGLEREREILKRLSFPEKRLKIIHVAGTNGKGSVCEYLTQILVAAGKRTGTFQTPAVYSYLEQFKLNGKPFDDLTLKKYFEIAADAASGLDASGFEVETAGALLAFAESGCEYAVIECGMGGRDDATNAVCTKELAVITSIGLEHTRYLGDTLGAIAQNKAEIIKNCPAIISALQTEEVKEYFCGKSAIFTGEPTEICRKGLNGQTFLYGGKVFETKMPGCAQPYNAAAAIDAARLLKTDESAIYTGVKTSKLGGRLEVLRSDGVTFLLDGAHNPASFIPLADFLKNNFDARHTAVIYGCLSDKDVFGCVKSLAHLARTITAVRPDNARGMDEEQIIKACRANFENAVLCGSVSEALIKLAGKYKNIIVCGSFTILWEAKQWIEKML